MLRLIGCVVASHDLRLLLIALAVCGVGAVTTLQMLVRAQATAGRARLLWIVSGGVAFGSGVWVTHFVAMLAYTPGLPIAFNVPLTIGSLLLAVSGGWFGLACATLPGRRAATGAGLLLGTTIGAMHFTGMKAFQVPGLLEYNASDVVAAWVVGCAFAPLAMLRLRTGKAVQSALLLLLAVVGLHFIAMTAVTIQSDTTIVEGVPTTSLAIAVAAVGLLVLSISLGSVLVDIHLERRSRSEDARLRRFADATFEGLFFIEGNTVQDANSVLCQMLGRPRNRIVGQAMSSFFAPESRSRLDVLDTRSMTGTEVELLDADGGRLVVDILARPLAAEGERVAVIAVRDASERKRAEHRIQQLVHIDPLTGLANRLLLRDRLMQALAMAERSKDAVAVLCLDLDRFKSVNDVMGHQAGDALLVEVANRLRVAVRDGDTVARLGGDEFMIVQFAPQQPEAAQALAQRLVRLLAQPVIFEGSPLEVTASIGIALSGESGSSSADRLLHQADLALYRAKQEGRDSFRFFEPAMDLKLQIRREMERDLRQAVSKGELQLHYQPVFDGDRLSIVGYEALLRWEHPTRGRVSPAEFIPLAEECGAILPIGAWVLEQACAEAALWEEPRTIAVNVSPVQIKQQGLSTLIADVLRRTGLPPGRLELEITEGVLIDDTARTLATLHALKEIGVRLALDDFGTGYSSLNYLRRFPFDRLKIDRSFVSEIGVDVEAGAIVRAIMALSDILRVAVTAEGVETNEQLEILRTLGSCDLQGYLLGRPASATHGALARQASSVLQQAAD